MSRHALSIHKHGRPSAELTGQTYPHDLALLLQHLEGHQLVHVVLPCAVIQDLLGAVDEAAQAVALAEGPPRHAVAAAHPLQGGDAQPQLACRLLHMAQTLLCYAMLCYNFHICLSCHTPLPDRHQVASAH